MSVRTITKAKNDSDWTVYLPFLKEIAQDIYKREGIGWNIDEEIIDSVINTLAENGFVILSDAGAAHLIEDALKG